jgi:integrase
MRLTQATVDRLELSQGKTERIVFDEVLPGFGIRLRAGGKRTWIVQYRIGSKQRRITLGSAKALTLETARKAAKGALAKAQLGSDPQFEKAEARARASLTLGAAADRYLTRCRTKLRPRSYREVERHLTRYWAPMREMPLHGLRRLDVAARLGEIANENGLIAANRARASLSALYGWAMGEGLVEANPVVGTHRPTEEVTRDRVLSDDELKAVWQHAGGGDFGCIVRLLILTGQRREEAGGMLWSELKLGQTVWSIGGERTKNGLPHDVPLSGPAAEILGARGQRDGRVFVFGSRVGRFQGWSKAKAALDARLLAAARLEHGPKAAVEPWRLHDLRRTVATRMGDLGVLPHVIEAVLNHISGHRRGVAGIYNRATYGSEKRRALDLWARHVETLCMGGPLKLASIADGKARA